jgi:hypothetical protein
MGFSIKAMLSSGSIRKFCSHAAIFASNSIVIGRLQARR